MIAKPLIDKIKPKRKMAILDREYDPNDIYVLINQNGYKYKIKVSEQPLIYRGDIRQLYMSNHIC